MSEIALNPERMESVKILLHEVMTKNHSVGKSTLLLDLSPRIPKEVTDAEFESLVNELETAGYVDFEPGLGVRARFKPGPRFSIWKNEFTKESKGIVSNTENKITIGNMINSQIQQGASNSSQTFTLAIEESTKFEKLVQKLREEALTMSLNPEDKNDLDLQISTLENQAKSTRKNRGIITGAIETITTIIQGAAGSGLWAILAELSNSL